VVEIGKWIEVLYMGCCVGAMSGGFCSVCCIVDGFCVGDGAGSGLRGLRLYGGCCCFGLVVCYGMYCWSVGV